MLLLWFVLSGENSGLTVLLVLGWIFKVLFLKVEYSLDGFKGICFDDLPFNSSIGVLKSKLWPYVDGG